VTGICEPSTEAAANYTSTASFTVQTLQASRSILYTSNKSCSDGQCTTTSKCALLQPNAIFSRRILPLSASRKLNRPTH